MKWLICYNFLFRCCRSYVWSRATTSNAHFGIIYWFYHFNEFQTIFSLSGISIILRFSNMLWLFRFSFSRALRWALPAIFYLRSFHFAVAVVLLLSHSISFSILLIIFSSVCIVLLPCACCMRMIIRYELLAVFVSSGRAIFSLCVSSSDKRQTKDEERQKKWAKSRKREKNIGKM